MTKICATSDLHGFLPDIPECDILLVAGDIAGPSEIFYQMRELYDNFIPWLNSVKAKKKIIVAGNHDLIFQRAVHLLPKWPDDVIYLQDDGVTLEGLNFYGTPWQLEFCDWAFNLTEEQLAERWAMIPETTDVLITHSPPYGYGDNMIGGKRLGSPSLTKRIKEVKPILHVFGHVHFGYGRYEIPVGDNKYTTACNVALCGENYKPNHPVLEFYFNDPAPPTDA